MSVLDNDQRPGWRAVQNCWRRIYVLTLGIQLTSQQFNSHFGLSNEARKDLISLFDDSWQHDQGGLGKAIKLLKRQKLFGLTNNYLIQ